MANFLLVHGSWHGPWCFGLLIDQLARRGHGAFAVALPSVWGQPGSACGLDADGEAVTRAAAAIDGPLFVLAHSYGGAAVTAAVMPSHVEHLIYLAAFMPDTGRTYPSYLPPGPLPPYVAMQDDGTFSVPAGQARAHFYHDCPESLSRWAESQLRPQSQAVLGEPIHDASWRHHRSSYILTTDDRALPPDFQRQFLPQAGEVHEFKSSHSPMLSRAAELAELLVACTGA